MNAAVKDVMTTRVIWVRKDASFKEMAAALREHRVSAFPVLDEHGRVRRLPASASAGSWPGWTVRSRPGPRWRGRSGRPG